ncbi:MAG: hypothetical protein HC902_12595 [Calothrix sp. SM1_5_4]|nr:hypothetical protein [Calothrix sp. SM1_5_4]
MRILTELESQTQDEFTRARTLFWLGKSLSKANKEDDAKAVFEKLTSLDPLGYYGLLAHRQLGVAISLKTGDGGRDGSGDAHGGDSPAPGLPFDTEIGRVAQSPRRKRSPHRPAGRSLPGVQESQ